MLEYSQQQQENQTMKTKILTAALFLASFAVMLCLMLEYVDCLTK